MARQDRRRSGDGDVPSPPAIRSDDDGDVGGSVDHRWPEVDEADRPDPESDLDSETDFASEAGRRHKERPSLRRADLTVRSYRTEGGTVTTFPPQEPPGAQT